MSNAPLKLNITVKVESGQSYEGSLYNYEINKTLTEHSLKEVKIRLERATEEVVEELRHSSFLKTHLAERQLAVVRAQEKLNETHKAIETEKEKVAEPF